MRYTTVVEKKEYAIIDGDTLLDKDNEVIVDLFLVRVTDYIDDQLNYSMCYVADSENVRDFSEYCYDQWYETSQALKSWRKKVLQANPGATKFANDPA